MLKIFITMIFLALGSFAYVFSGLPDAQDMNQLKLMSASQVYDIHGELIAKLFEENRVVVPLNKMSPYLIDAIIANEDTRFYQHRGIDPIGIARALVVNITSGDIAEGGSTITQQLARGMFLNQDRTLLRKIREAILAIKLDVRFSKEEILHAYLNQIYLGEGAYGVEAASQAYFGKSADDLDLSESAMIAGLAKGPIYYSPYNNIERAKERRDTVINGMYLQGYITEAMKADATQEILKIKSKRERSVKASYFLDYVAKELVDLYGEEKVYTGGLKIYTTLDMRLQKIAEQTLKEYQGAVVAINPSNGYIHAMVGGNNYSESQLNRVTDEYRQPGSAFKPIVYATAINKGMKTNTVMVDEPINIAGYKPQNYDNKYRGAMTLKKALRWSVNTVAVKVGQQAGMHDVIQLANNLGLSTITKADEHLATVLGGVSAGVNLLDLSTAYTAFANGGILSKPIAVLEVRNEHDQVLDTFTTQQSAVLSPETAYIMTDMLMGTIYNGTASGANIGREAAGKTGTTDNYETAWFIGYIPDLLVGIYVGNDNRVPTDLSGTQVAEMWGEFMKQAISNKQKKDFSVPDTIIKGIDICANTGELAEANCKDHEYSAFIKGTEPKRFTDKIIEKILPKEEKGSEREKKNKWWFNFPGLPKL